MYVLEYFSRANEPMGIIGPFATKTEAVDWAKAEAPDTQILAPDSAHLVMERRPSVGYKNRFELVELCDPTHPAWRPEKK